jgi:RHS repeat-associated protein
MLGSTTTTTDYTYDGITQLSLAAVRGSTTWKVAYLYDEEGRPCAGIYQAGTSTPVTFLIASTDRGDVVALTNTAGAPFARYTYDPYGRVLTQTSNSVTGITLSVASAIRDRQPLRYAGYAYDAHSATYYLSARHYDPATMRFLTKDPARDDGEESAYQYCAGDPVGKVDPTGLASVFYTGMHLYRGEIRVLWATVSRLRTVVATVLGHSMFYLLRMPVTTTTALVYLDWRVRVEYKFYYWRDKYVGGKKQSRSLPLVKGGRTFSLRTTWPSSNSLSFHARLVKEEAVKRMKNSQSRASNVVVHRNAWSVTGVDEFSEDMVMKPMEVTARIHVLPLVPLNPAAVLLAPLWGLMHKVWVGLLVPLPSIIWSWSAWSVAQWIPSMRIQDFLLSPALEWILLLVPAVWFAWHADRMAWDANQGRWDDEASYRRVQRVWAIGAVVLWVLMALADRPIVVQ